MGNKRDDFDKYCRDFRKNHNIDFCWTVFDKLNEDLGKDDKYRS